MNKVLVLGIAGFIGKKFIRYIKQHDLQKNFQFIGCDIVHPDDSDFLFDLTDLSNKNNIIRLLTQRQPDYIINLAGKIRGQSLDDLSFFNAVIPKLICETVIREELNVKKIVCIGSAAEYGNNDDLPLHENSAFQPVNDYGLSKVKQTEYIRHFVQHHSLSCNIARIFNIIGEDIPSMLSIGNFIRQIKEAGNGQTILTGNLNSRRDFLYIDDVVDAIWKIMLSGKKGEEYNVCSGKSISMKEILDNLIRFSGKKLTIHQDKNLLKKDDVPDSYGDNSKLMKDTGWSPGEIDYKKLMVNK